MSAKQGHCSRRAGPSLTAARPALCAERVGGEEDATAEVWSDPVCGMVVRAASAAAERTRSGQRYLFWSLACAERFDADPAQFERAARSADLPGCGTGPPQ